MSLQVKFFELKSSDVFFFIRYGRCTCWSNCIRDSFVADMVQYSPYFLNSVLSLLLISILQRLSSLNSNFSQHGWNHSTKSILEARNWLCCSRQKIFFSIYTLKNRSLSKKANCVFLSEPLLLRCFLGSKSFF